MNRTTSHCKLSAGQWRWRRIRKRTMVFAIFLAGALLVSLADRAGWFGRRQGADWPRYHGRIVRVVHVVDGDTLDVNLSDGRETYTRVRLWGVDTPESVKPDHPVEHFALEAGAFTRQMVDGRCVRLELLPHRMRDKYGRVLAYVYLDDERMLNRVLIEQGLGYADSRFAHRYQREFRDLQAEARAAGRGLWARVRPEDLPDYFSR